MSQTFCKHLTHTLRIEYDRLHPCCWFRDSADIRDPEAVQRFLKKIKLIDSWENALPDCNECHMREKKQLFSPRLESFSRKDFVQMRDDQRGLIEIQIDNDCNGACLICGPWNSTTWEKYQNNTINRIPISDVSENSKSQTHDLLEKISQSIDLSQAQVIMFLGGEPLKTDSHLRILKLIPDPEAVTVRYTTNGSYLPDQETLSTWQRFKEVQIMFSIDGIGEHFDYLRWPLRWNQIEKNIEFLQTNPTSNIAITQFSYTVTPFSLFYHDRYQDWSMRVFGKDMFKTAWQPRGGEMMLSSTPKKLRDAIEEKYGRDHMIFRILEPFKVDSYQRFMSYISLHDHHRNLDWKSVFPEIVEYFSE